MALTSTGGSKTAATAGLVGGYLVQNGPWVLGLEAQIDPTAISTRSTGSAGPDTRSPLVCEPDPPYSLNAVGVKADCQLTGQWRLSAEYAYSAFGAVKLRLTDGGANANIVSVTPPLQALRIGLTRRF
jgi:hypothetical protein